MPILNINIKTSSKDENPAIISFSSDNLRVNHLIALEEKMKQDEFKNLFERKVGIYDKQVSLLLSYTFNDQKVKSLAIADYAVVL